MRGTSNNLSCYDCGNCIDRHGTSHGFCKEKKEPIGGLHWTTEEFDRCPSHIFPTFAGSCWTFKPDYPFTIRMPRVVIYIATVEKLEEVFANLRGESIK